MLKGISKEWQNILYNDELQNIKEKIRAITPDDKICPPKEKWFEFARLTPLDNIKIIIVGQDAYYTDGTAQGLCFSSLDKKIPPSLMNIYKCLKNSELIDKMPDTADISYWARQGVLLINVGITTEKGIAGKHLRIWANYSINLFKNISEYGIKNNKRFIYFLWGNYAQNLKNFVDPGHIVMTWTHPSPLAQRGPEEKRFINCNHFKEANKLLSSWGVDVINWNPICDEERKEEKIICHSVFVDGACKGNGSKTASGGYAAIFVDGPWKDREVAEPLQNTTNIRAEAAAIIKVLELLNEEEEWDKCAIYTDSEFWRKMIYEYMPRWSEETFNKKANPDLTKKIWELWRGIKNKNQYIEIIWVPAHNKRGWKTSENAYEKWCYMNNERVDKLANSV